MPSFVLTWLVTAASLVITAQLVPGLKVDSIIAAIIAAILLGFVNAIVRPVLILLTLPLTFLTLGLFLFIVNGISLGLVAVLTPGFAIAGFFPALVGSIILTILSSLIQFLVGRGVA